MSCKPFSQHMYENCTDRWDYAVAYGWVQQSVHLFLHGHITADQLRAVDMDVEFHKKAYYVLRDQGVTATAALEQLRYQGHKAVAGLDSPATRGATPR
jgi:hypothetical protein